MKNILVPIDFSDTSIKAVMYGAAIASKTDAVLHLLHVIVPPPFSLSDIPLPDYNLTEELQAQAVERMEQLKKDVALNNTCLDISIVVLEGEVRSTILRYVTTNGSDLIVMGTEGASGFKGLLWSTLTAKTLMHSPVPVIAVPAEYMLSEPRKILFATNRFEDDPSIIDAVFNFAEIFNAAVQVMIFLDKENAPALEYLEAGKELERYRRLLQGRYPRILLKSELLDGSDFENALALYESREEIDLIAMITYPKGFFEKLTGKTVTKKMAMHSRIPVLAIPVKTMFVSRDTTAAAI